MQYRELGVLVGGIEYGSQGVRNHSGKSKCTGEMTSER